jgi:hypothetical protein
MSLKNALLDKFPFIKEKVTYVHMHNRFYFIHICGMTDKRIVSKEIYVRQNEAWQTYFYLVNNPYRQKFYYQNLYHLKYNFNAIYKLNQFNFTTGKPYK